MSIKAKIRRKGSPVTWRKMAGVGGVYDTSTLSMTAVPPSTTPIYGIIDGFGTVANQLFSETAVPDTTRVTGELRVYTAERIEMGDTLEFGGRVHTVYDVKSVWKRKSEVLFMSLVHV